MKPYDQKKDQKSYVPDGQGQTQSVMVSSEIENAKWVPDWIKIKYYRWVGKRDDSD